MPLFGNKFSPKKGVPRRSTSLSNLNLDANERQEEFGLDYGPLKIKLGSNEIKFDKGNWFAETLEGGSNQREVSSLKKENQKLLEENNLLKLKMELLLDMLSETTANTYLLENEVEQMRKSMRKK